MHELLADYLYTVICRVIGALMYKQSRERWTRRYAEVGAGGCDQVGALNAGWGHCSRRDVSNCYRICLLFCLCERRKRACPFAKMAAERKKRALSLHDFLVLGRSSRRGCDAAPSQLGSNLNFSFDWLSSVKSRARSLLCSLIFLLMNLGLFLLKFLLWFYLLNVGVLGPREKNYLASKSLKIVLQRKVWQ